MIRTKAACAKSPENKPFFAAASQKRPFAKGIRNALDYQGAGLYALGSARITS